MNVGYAFHEVNITIELLKTLFTGMFYSSRLNSFYVIMAQPRR